MKTIMSTLFVVPSLLLFSCAAAPDLPDSAPLLQPGNFVHNPGPNPAMICGEEGTWDDRALESADCFKDNKTYYWYYHAFSQKELKECNYKIGVATAVRLQNIWHSRVPELVETFTFVSKSIAFLNADVSALSYLRASSIASLLSQYTSSGLTFARTSRYP